MPERPTLTCQWLYGYGPRNNVSPKGSHVLCWGTLVEQHKMCIGVIDKCLPPTEYVPAISSRWHCEPNKSRGKSRSGQFLTKRVFADFRWAKKKSNANERQLRLSWVGAEPSQTLCLELCVGQWPSVPTHLKQAEVGLRAPRKRDTGRSLGAEERGDWLTCSSGLRGSKAESALDSPDTGYMRGEIGFPWNAGWGFFETTHVLRGKVVRGYLNTNPPQRSPCQRKPTALPPRKRLCAPPNGRRDGCPQGTQKLPKTKDFRNPWYPGDTRL